MLPQHHEAARQVSLLLAPRLAPAVKALPRDAREPDVSAKRDFESEIQAALNAHWERQKRQIREALKQGLTSIPDLAASDAALQAGLVSIMTRSLISGGTLFAERTTLGLDPTLINAEAAAWARQYVGDLVRGIDAQTLTAVRQQVSNFVTTPGYTIGDVMDNLPFTEYRGQLVATTEITRAYAEGNKLAGQKLETQYPGVQVIEIWYTNNDDRVCPICGPLDGKRVGLREKFIVRLKNGKVVELDRPPAHPGCRCWTTTTTNIDKRQ